MSSLIIQQLPLLELLAKVNPESRLKILKNCNQNLIKAIVECVRNVIKKNVQIKATRIEKLKKYKKTLRQIANSKNKIDNNKKIIVQSGGHFLPILLTPIVSYLFDQILPKK